MRACALLLPILLLIHGSKAATFSKRVLVVGSINIDLFASLDKQNQATFAGAPVDFSAVKGMTLPARSFLLQEAVAADLERSGARWEKGAEEDFVLSLDGPFTQLTGGKGANAAVAAAQTASGNAEFIGQLGMVSEAANGVLLDDMARYGGVDTTRCAVLRDAPTGTAYILRFADSGDNAILLLGGANMAWPSADALRSGAEGPPLRAAIADCAALMLQREIPPHVNVVVASLAAEAGAPHAHGMCMCT